MAPQWAYEPVLQRRPISPLEFDPIIPRPEDILYAGDSQDDSPALRQAKKRRREELGRAYLKDQFAFVVTYQLRGPLNDGWQNPWAERGPVEGARGGLGRLDRQHLGKGTRATSPIDLISEAGDGDKVVKNHPAKVLRNGYDTRKPTTEQWLTSNLHNTGQRSARQISPSLMKKQWLDDQVRCLIPASEGLVQLPSKNATMKPPTIANSTRVEPPIVAPDIAADELQSVSRESNDVSPRRSPSVELGSSSQPVTGGNFSTSSKEDKLLELQLKKKKKSLIKRLAEIDDQARSNSIDSVTRLALRTEKQRLQLAVSTVTLYKNQRKKKKSLLKRLAMINGQAPSNCIDSVARLALRTGQETLQQEIFALNDQINTSETNLLREEISKKQALGDLLPLASTEAESKPKKRRWPSNSDGSRYRLGQAVQIKQEILAGNNLRRVPSLQVFNSPVDVVSNKETYSMDLQSPSVEPISAKKAQKKARHLARKAERERLAETTERQIETRNSGSHIADVDEVCADSFSTAISDLYVPSQDTNGKTKSPKRRKKRKSEAAGRDVLDDANNLESVMSSVPKSAKKRKHATLEEVEEVRRPEHISDPATKPRRKHKKSDKLQEAQRKEAAVSLQPRPSTDLKSHHLHKHKKRKLSTVKEEEIPKDVVQPQSPVDELRKRRKKRSRSKAMEKQPVTGVKITNTSSLVDEKPLTEMNTATNPSSSQNLLGFKTSWKPYNWQVPENTKGQAMSTTWPVSNTSHEEGTPRTPVEYAESPQRSSRRKKAAHGSAEHIEPCTDGQSPQKRKDRTSSVKIRKHTDKGKTTHLGDHADKPCVIVDLMSEDNDTGPLASSITVKEEASGPTVPIQSSMGSKSSQRVSRKLFEPASIRRIQINDTPAASKLVPEAQSLHVDTPGSKSALPSHTHQTPEGTQDESRRPSMDSVNTSWRKIHNALLVESPTATPNVTKAAQSKPLPPEQSGGAERRSRRHTNQPGTPIEGDRNDLNHKQKIDKTLPEAAPPTRKTLTTSEFLNDISPSKGRTESDIVSVPNSSTILESSAQNARQGSQVVTRDMAKRYTSSQGSPKILMTDRRSSSRTKERHHAAGLEFPRIHSSTTDFSDLDGKRTAGTSMAAPKKRLSFTPNGNVKYAIAVQVPKRPEDVSVKVRTFSSVDDDCQIIEVHNSPGTSQKNCSRIWKAASGTAVAGMSEVLPDGQITSNPQQATLGLSASLLETDKQSLKFTSTADADSEVQISTQAEFVKAQRSLQTDLESLTKESATPRNTGSAKPTTSSAQPARPSLRTLNDPFIGAGTLSQEPLSTQAMVDAMSPFAISTVKPKRGFLDAITRPTAALFQYMQGRESQDQSTDPDPPTHLPNRPSPRNSNSLPIDENFSKSGLDMETSPEAPSAYHLSQPDRHNATPPLASEYYQSTTGFTPINAPPPTPSHANAVDDDSTSNNSTYFKASSSIHRDGSPPRDDAGGWITTASALSPSSSAQKRERRTTLRSFSSSSLQDAQRKTEPDGLMREAMDEVMGFLGTWDIEREVRAVGAGVGSFTGREGRR